METIEYKLAKPIEVILDKNGMINYTSLLLQLCSDENRQKSIVESIKSQLSKKRKCVVVTKFVDQSLKLKKNLETECKGVSCTFIRPGTKVKDFENADVLITTLAMFQATQLSEIFEVVVVTIPITKCLPSSFFTKRVLYVNDTYPKEMQRQWVKFKRCYSSSIEKEANRDLS
jgi:hypothetical protein